MGYEQLECRVVLIGDALDHNNYTGPKEKVDTAPLLRLRKRNPGFILDFMDAYSWTNYEPYAMTDVSGRLQGGRTSMPLLSAS
jgi:hypothetical protein